MTNTHYIDSRELDAMNRKLARNWAAGVAVVASLNILGVVPNWTTLAAVLSLPFALSSTASRCLPRRER